MLVAVCGNFVPQLPLLPLLHDNLLRVDPEVILLKNRKLVGHLQCVIIGEVEHTVAVCANALLLGVSVVVHQHSVESNESNISSAVETALKRIASQNNCNFCITSVADTLIHAQLQHLSVFHDTNGRVEVEAVAHARTTAEAAQNAVRCFAHFARQSALTFKITKTTSQTSSNLSVHAQAKIANGLRMQASCYASQFSPVTQILVKKDNATIGRATVTVDTLGAAVPLIIAYVKSGKMFGMQDRFMAYPQGLRPAICSAFTNDDTWCDVTGASACEAQFRDYASCTNATSLYYVKQRKSMTVAFAQDIKLRYARRTKVKFSVAALLKFANSIHDPSDPDAQHGQRVHALQTAQSALRKQLPPWMIATALVHDLGKTLERFDGFGEDAVLHGDIFPCGVPVQPDVIFGEAAPKVTQCTATAGCGFDALHFWGHDEVLYQALMVSATTLPAEALYVIRYHSFYAWHQHLNYAEYASTRDWQMLTHLQTFQRLDLYTKTDATVSSETEAAILTLADTFFPNGILL